MCFLSCVKRIVYATRSCLFSFFFATLFTIFFLTSELLEVTLILFENCLLQRKKKGWSRGNENKRWVPFSYTDYLWCASSSVKNSTRVLNLPPLYRVRIFRIFTRWFFMALRFHSNDECWVTFLSARPKFWLVNDSMEFRRSEFPAGIKWWTFAAT